MLNKIKTQLSIGLAALVMTANTAFAQWGAQKTENLPWLPGLDAKKWIINNPTTAADTVMASVKNVVNRWLGLLAFIAIVILVRAGFKMLFNANDDGEQKKAFATVRNVAIALIFIGCSRLIVTAIFRLVWEFTK